MITIKVLNHFYQLRPLFKWWLSEEDEREVVGALLSLMWPKLRQVLASPTCNIEWMAC
jgi:hypothetical protein